MDIKNKLKQIRAGSMSHHFCTDYCSLEYLIKACVFLCNTPLVFSAL